jgi:hypothetical protein
MLETIERKPQIDGLSEQGEIPAQRCTGEISVRGVTFAYPSRPDASVCVDYKLDILPGDTVALVGASGCGKVSVVAHRNVARNSCSLQGCFPRTSCSCATEHDREPAAALLRPAGRAGAAGRPGPARAQRALPALSDRVKLLVCCMLTVTNTHNFGIALLQVRGPGTSAVCRNYWREYRIRSQRRDAGRGGRRYYTSAQSC